MAETMHSLRKTAVTLSDADFGRFRDYFYRRTGIYFEDSKRYFVDKRLLERMRLTGHEEFRGYFAALRFRAVGDEFQNLVNAMTVNETYFMRERYQFDCLVEEVLEEVMRRREGSRPIRIWVIPSSTGEEPYSLALTLLSRWPLIDSVDVEIVASDIDTSVLERARLGVYTGRSLQHVDSELRRRYFNELGGGRWQIADFIRDAVSFSRVNLLEPEHLRGYRDFDIILCRNLLIYFDDASRRRAASILYDALDEGGFIFLGHSESMSRISSSYQVRRFKHALVYQKPWKRPRSEP
ncbi:CheR family methyltransferase [Kushneria aurantia]|uniref:Chemotaxis protein methyltransferase n=1 Tax=Kushneria aurantia TaxID=504092 RepID=A0ABV6G7Y8_9GAMM|nr:protein-glutamate O-methyltransferase CheR [Kushneria aurantia]